MAIELLADGNDRIEVASRNLSKAHDVFFNRWESRTRQVVIGQEQCRARNTKHKVIPLLQAASSD